MKYTIQEAYADVDKIIADESAHLASLEPKGLYEPVKYTLDLGGKRLRPLLVLLAYKTFRPIGDPEDAAPLMKAVELFHNFSLIHDDLMDDAPIRRGKPTVFKEWGSNQAVLSGDAMLIEAYTALCYAPSDDLPAFLDVFNHIASGVCIGQQMDMEFETKSLADISIEDYMQMIYYKTGVLFTGSVLLGTLLGGVTTQKDLDTVRLAMTGFGKAFQVMDDYLDVFSDVEAFGKRRGGDILEGKKTFLLLDAYSKAPEEVDRILSITDEETKINEMTDLYKRLGSDKTALEMVERLTEETVGRLSSMRADTSLLQELMHSLLLRHK